MRCLFSVLMVAMTVPALAADDPATVSNVFSKAGRIVFLGDSITASGTYVALVDAALHVQHGDRPPTVINAGLSSETVSGLSEDGHAGGKFPRPDVHERLARVLALTKPDLVVACYGINCGIYQPFDEMRFAAYKNGYSKLRDAVRAAGSELVIVTPPFFDDQRSPKEFSYNAVLDRYSDWLVSQRAQGWLVIDLHSVMTEAVLEQRKADPKFTLQPDGVHPNVEGHVLMATVLARQLGTDLPGDLPTTPELFFRGLQLPEGAWPLFQKRMAIRRDAYVAAAGHKRPGVAAGLPIDDANIKASELTSEIRAIIPPR